MATRRGHLLADLNRGEPPVRGGEGGLLGHPWRTRVARRRAEVVAAPFQVGVRLEPSHAGVAWIGSAVEARVSCHRCPLPTTGKPLVLIAFAIPGVGLPYGNRDPVDLITRPYYRATSPECPRQTAGRVAIGLGNVERSIAPKLVDKFASQALKRSFVWSVIGMFV